MIWVFLGLAWIVLELWSIFSYFKKHKRFSDFPSYLPLLPTTEMDSIRPQILHFLQTVKNPRAFLEGALFERPITQVLVLRFLLCYLHPQIGRYAPFVRRNLRGYDAEEIREASEIINEWDLNLPPGEDFDRYHHLPWPAHLSHFSKGYKSLLIRLLKYVLQAFMTWWMDFDRFHLENSTIHYQINGKNYDWIVFIPGIASGIWPYHNFIKSLQAIFPHHNFLFLEAWNFDSIFSLPSAKPIGLYAASADLHNAFIRLEIPNAHIIGHSYGSAISMTFKRRYPSQVIKQVWCDAPLAFGPIMFSCTSFFDNITWSKRYLRNSILDLETMFTVLRADESFSFLASERERRDRNILSIWGEDDELCDGKQAFETIEEYFGKNISNQILLKEHTHTSTIWAPTDVMNAIANHIGKTKIQCEKSTIRLADLED